MKVPARSPLAALSGCAGRLSAAPGVALLFGGLLAGLPWNRGLAANAWAADKTMAAQAAQPWGRLEISRVFLQAPRSLLEFTEAPDQRTIWSFPGMDWPRVKGFLVNVGLTAEQVEQICAPGLRNVSGSGVALTPSVEFLVGLSPASRQLIYDELGRHEANPDHRRPLLIFGDFEEWAAGSGLSADHRRLVERLLWKKGDLAAFSDLSALLERAASLHEMTEARRFMTRRHSYLVRVTSPEPALQGAFVDYWAGKGRNPEVIPLLDAVAGAGGRKVVDLPLLLPSLARERLYSFPTLKDAVAGRLPDCHWSSLNFFAVRPEPYYLDSRVSFLELTQGYLALEEPSELGDLICFIDGGGSVLHSCVHLAEDLVFTKNGQSLFAPWVIMRRREVEDIYRPNGAVAVRFLRRKDSDTK